MRDHLVGHCANLLAIYEDFEDWLPVEASKNIFEGVILSGVLPHSLIGS
jgi:hypothetical protein